MEGQKESGKWREKRGVENEKGREGRRDGEGGGGGKDRWGEAEGITFSLKVLIIRRKTTPPPPHASQPLFFSSLLLFLFFFSPFSNSFYFFSASSSSLMLPSWFSYLLFLIQTLILHPFSSLIFPYPPSLFLPPPPFPSEKSAASCREISGACRRRTLQPRDKF